MKYCKSGKSERRNGVFPKKEYTWVVKHWNLNSGASTPSLKDCYKVCSMNFIVSNNIPTHNIIKKCDTGREAEALAQALNVI